MLRKVWFIFAVTCLLTIPIRIYQLLMFVDTGTGFFTDGNVTAAAITVLLVISCAAMLILCRKSGGFTAKFWDLHSIPAVVFALLAAASMVAQSVAKLFEITAPVSSEVASPDIEPQTVQHPFLSAALAIVCIVAAVLMAVTAAGLARRSNPYRNFPVLALIVPLWSCLDLAVLFVRYTEVVNTIESIYAMFMVIFLLLCLFAQAQFFAGADDAKSRQTMLASGFCFSVLSLTVTVPNCVMYVLGKPQVCSLSLPDSLVYLFLALFLQALFFPLVFPRRAVHGDGADRA